MGDLDVFDATGNVGCTESLLKGELSVGITKPIFTTQIMVMSLDCKYG